MTAGRIATFAVAAAVLGGCTVEVPFDCAWSLSVVAPPGERVTAVPMDLSAQEELWARREQVEEVRPEAARLTILGVGTMNRADAVVVGLRYRPDDAASGERDVVLLTRTTVPLVEGASVVIVPPEGLGPAIQGTLEGSGRFTLLFETEGGAVMEATIELALSGSVLATP